jgi:hypothetical protein
LDNRQDVVDILHAIQLYQLLFHAQLHYCHHMRVIRGCQRGNQELSCAPGIFSRLSERCDSLHQILHLQVQPVILCCTLSLIRSNLQWNRLNQYFLFS